MANQIMLDFNNQAVENILDGNVFPAFELLSEAADMLPPPIPLEDEDDFPNYPALQEYIYVWCDCKHIFQGGVPDGLDEKCKIVNESCLTFVQKALIKVYPRYDDPIYHGFPLYGFSWVIRFNLAVLCTIYGICLGERGHKLCERAKYLMDHVQIRFDEELLVPSRQWTLPQLVVFNNQACVAYELGLTGDMIESADDVNNIVDTPDYYDIVGIDCKDFSLCANMLLKSSRMASAA